MAQTLRQKIVHSKARYAIQDRVMIGLMRVINFFNLGGEYTNAIRHTLEEIDNGNMEEDKNG
jgi:hypothetical protein